MRKERRMSEERYPSKVFFTYNVDAVEVVRCKDCKWSYTDERTLVCGYRGFFVNEAFFCADGKRKEE